MPVQSTRELRLLMAALIDMRVVPNDLWEHPDRRVEEVLREYLIIWRRAEKK